MIEDFADVEYYTKPLEEEIARLRAENERLREKVLQYEKHIEAAQEAYRILRDQVVSGTPTKLADEF